MAPWLTTRIRNNNGILLALPALTWLLLFFVLPLVIVFVVSLMSRGSGGTAVLPFTFDQYERVFTAFSSVIERSIRISVLTTVVCLIIGFPMAFFIKTRKHALSRQLALFFVILPFWTNFLVRTYAWRILLGREGTFNAVLMQLGIISEPLQLLNTEFAVLLGLVYGFLPFMVLPIYASVERFDFHLVEASRDLGANDWRTFWRVVLPLTLPGVIAGCILVFIPAIGTYVTSDMLGGTSGLMIGNLIQGQYRGSGNTPLGAASSMVLMGLVMIALFVYLRFASREG